MAAPAGRAEADHQEDAPGQRLGPEAREGAVGLAGHEGHHGQRDVLHEDLLGIPGDLTRKEELAPMTLTRRKKSDWTRKVLCCCTLWLLRWGHFCLRGAVNRVTEFLHRVNKREIL